MSKTNDKILQTSLHPAKDSMKSTIIVEKNNVNTNEQNDNLNYFKVSDQNANIRSYGNIGGSYNIPENVLYSIILDKYICKEFALVEKRTDYCKI